MSTNYEKFIVANQELMDCYAKVPASEFSAMPVYDQKNVCQAEATAVSDFLKNGQVSFASILKERIASFDWDNP